MNNPPAFPLIGHTFVNEGMSTLEYAAIEAMKGILAGTNPVGPWPDPLWLAEKAYQYADAMLAQGQKEKS